MGCAGRPPGRYLNSPPAHAPRSHDTRFPSFARKHSGRPRSVGDVRFSCFVLLAESIVIAKGIAEDDVAAQLETVNKAHIEMMRHATPASSCAGRKLVRRLE